MPNGQLGQVIIPARLQAMGFPSSLDVIAAPDLAGALDAWSSRELAAAREMDYQVFTFALDSARNAADDAPAVTPPGSLIAVPGSSFTVLALDPGATAQLRLDRALADAIPLADKLSIAEIRFNRLRLSNAAQVGKSLTLLIWG